MREGHYQNKLFLNYFSFVPKQLIRPGVSLQMCYVFENFKNMPARLLVFTWLNTTVSG